MCVSGTCWEGVVHAGGVHAHLCFFLNFALRAAIFAAACLTRAETRRAVPTSVTSTRRPPEVTVTRRPRRVRPLGPTRMEPWSCALCHGGSFPRRLPGVGRFGPVSSRFIKALLFASASWSCDGYSGVVVRQNRRGESWCSNTIPHYHRLDEICGPCAPGAERWCPPALTPEDG